MVTVSVIWYRSTVNRASRVVLTVQMELIKKPAMTRRHHRQCRKKKLNKTAMPAAQQQREQKPKNLFHFKSTRPFDVRFLRKTIHNNERVRDDTRLHCIELAMTITTATHNGIYCKTVNRKFTKASQNANNNHDGSAKSKRKFQSEILNWKCCCTKPLRLLFARENREKKKGWKERARGRERVRSRRVRVEDR